MKVIVLGSGVVGTRFHQPGMGLRTEAQTHIGREPLEQRAGISGLGFMTFFGSQCPSGNRG